MCVCFVRERKRERQRVRERDENDVQPHVAVLGLETLASILDHTVVRESV